MSDPLSAVNDVAVVFGGPSPEHDVSVLTGLQAARAMSGAPGIGELHALYWSKAGDWYVVDPGSEASAFVEGVPRGAAPVRLVTGSDGGFVAEGGRFGRSRRLSVDVAVVCCHGGPGEDGTLQAALDLGGVRYTGPTVAGAALGMDKFAFWAVVAATGLPALPRVLLRPDATPPAPGGPYIVKPRFGGSSIGIEVVADFATALARTGANAHLRAGAVIEPFREDLFDLQVAVRSYPALELSAIERPLRSARRGGAGEPEILAYVDKYVGGEGMASAPREVPAAIPAPLAESIRHAAATVAAVAGVRGVARVDFLSDGKELLYVNEVNTVPGSLARYLWVDPELPFRSLLADLVAEAVNRPSHHWTSSGADGTVLRGAATIAAKLA